MASMISIISLFVLSLCTYSYSIPVGVQYSLSTPLYPFASNGSLFQNGSSWYNGSVGYQVPTGPSYVQRPRGSTDLSSEETTTAYGRPVTPRSIGESNSAESLNTYGTPVTPRSIGESNSAESLTTYGTPVTPRSIEELNSAEARAVKDTTPLRKPYQPTNPIYRAKQPTNPVYGEKQPTNPVYGANKPFNQRAIPNYSGEVEEITSTQSSEESQEETNQVQSSTSVNVWPSNQKPGSSFRPRAMSAARTPPSISENSMEQVEKRSYGSMSGGPSGPVIVDTVKSGPNYGGDAGSYGTDTFSSKSASKLVQRQKKGTSGPW